MILNLAWMVLQTLESSMESCHEEAAGEADDARVPTPRVSARVGEHRPGGRSESPVHLFYTPNESQRHGTITGVPDSLPGRARYDTVGSSKR
jgi:hypothetical protein